MECRRNETAMQPKEESCIHPRCDRLMKQALNTAYLAIPRTPGVRFQPDPFHNNTLPTKFFNHASSRDFVILPRLQQHPRPTRSSSPNYHTLRDLPHHQQKYQLDPPHHPFVSHLPAPFRSLADDTHIPNRRFCIPFSFERKSITYTITHRQRHPDLGEHSGLLSQMRGPRDKIPQRADAQRG